MGTSFIPDPYKALNLPHSASLSQIKQAYRQLARKHHPDTWSQPCFSDADRKEATAKFTAISNAYALLTDARQKSDYDRAYNLGGHREEEDEEERKEETPPGERNATNTRQYSIPQPPPPACPPPPLTKAITSGCWVSAIDPRTRRTYYYNKATGERAWSLTPTSPNRANHNAYYSDADYHRMNQDADQQHPPDHHACESYTALVLCPPLGVVAVYHSIMVQRCWKQGSYVDARRHARLAPQYACWANCLGVCFWLYWFLVRGNEDLFDFDWNELWDEGP